MLTHTHTYVELVNVDSDKINKTKLNTERRLRRMVLKIPELQLHFSSYITRILPNKTRIYRAYINHRKWCASQIRAENNKTFARRTAETELGRSVISVHIVPILCIMVFVIQLG